MMSSQNACWAYILVFDLEKVSLEFLKLSLKAIIVQGRVNSLHTEVTN